MIAPELTPFEVECLRVIREDDDGDSGEPKGAWYAYLNRSDGARRERALRKLVHMRLVDQEWFITDAGRAWLQNSGVTW